MLFIMVLKEIPLIAIIAVIAATINASGIKFLHKNKETIKIIVRIIFILESILCTTDFPGKY